MWIRSQNKEVLAQVDNFVVRPVEPGFFDLASRIAINKFPHGIFKRFLRMSTSYLTLGTFPTREAALAELDVIQRWVERGGSDPGVWQMRKP